MCHKHGTHRIKQGFRGLHKVNNVVSASFPSNAGVVDICRAGSRGKRISDGRRTQVVGPRARAPDAPARKRPQNQLPRKPLGTPVSTTCFWSNLPNIGCSIATIRDRLG